MKKKISRTLSLVLTLVLVFSSISLPADAATSIASFGSSGLYYWKWKKITCHQDAVEAGFFNSELVSTNRCRALITAHQPDTGYNFYVSSSSNISGQRWSMSRRTYYEDWFETDRDVFITSEAHDTPLVKCNSSVLTSDTVNFYWPNVEFTYSQDGTVTENSSVMYYKGLGNGSSCNWSVTARSYGEEFTLTYMNDEGDLHIIETSNTKYHWYIDDSAIRETKDGFGKTVNGYNAEYFRIWVGSFVNIPGLKSGEYVVNSGKSIVADADVTVIGEDAVLTIEKDATLFVKGTLYVYGSIENYGSIVVCDGGELVIGESENVTKMDSSNGVHLLYTSNSCGALVVSNGGKLNIHENHSLCVSNNATFECDGTVRIHGIIGLYTMSSPRFVLTSNSTVIIPYGYAIGFYGSFVWISDTYGICVDNSAVYSGWVKLRDNL